MKLVVAQQKMASAQNKVILMYEHDGVKITACHEPGQVFEVDDEEGLAILSTPHLKGVVSIEGSKAPTQKAMSSAPRNK